MDETRRRVIVTLVFSLLFAFVGIAGAGHAYLRRWRRSIAWFLFSLGAGVALIYYYTDDPATVDPMNVPTAVTLPLLVILFLSVFDAYLVAKRTGRSGRVTTADGADADDEAPTVRCPNCRRETDPEFDFCAWCAEPLSEPNEADD
ncbi:DUF7575 domain-containing protein [Haloferacaceae archaeon DSL9]